MFVANFVCVAIYQDQANHQNSLVSDCFHHAGHLNTLARCNGWSPLACDTEYPQGRVNLS
jgi:hypothetical protein